jgi:ferredoxin
MGHIVTQDIYTKLGKKIDRLEVRVTQNELLYSILRELYTPEEAEIVVKMPYGLQTLARIAQVTGYDEAKLRGSLERLCEKGLVIDLFIQDRYYYSVSPMVIGIFEFSMMRRGRGANHKEMARLFSKYLLADDGLVFANSRRGQQIARMRAIPHEETIEASDYVEVLDYEKATAIIEGHDKFAIGYCSCRHEKLHLGQKKCEVPLETCTSFSLAADYLVRNGLAREATRSEMLENLARSREFGLVLLTDNTKNKPSFICNCCTCCCNALAGIRKFDWSHFVVSSAFLPAFSQDTCVGCGTCAKSCPIGAIEMVPVEGSDRKRKKEPKVDESTCLGCGVCALKCKKEAIDLVRGTRRAIFPETTFERVLLQCLEKGTLQYQIFDNPNSLTHRFLQVFFGAFLSLSPTRKVLMSEMFRSSFLHMMQKGARIKGKGFVTTL